MSQQELREALKQARIRLDILRGRIESCHEKHPEEHLVTVEELPLWIKQMDKQLSKLKILTPERRACVISAQLLYTHLQNLKDFGDAEADLSYALLAYIREDWQE